MSMAMLSTGFNCWLVLRSKFFKVAFHLRDWSLFMAGGGEVEGGLRKYFNV